MSDQIGSANSCGDAWDVAMALLPSLELTKVVYMDLSKASAPIVMSNAGDRWTKAYSSKVVSGEDPFAANCLSRVDPVLTGIGHLEDHTYLGHEALEQIAKGSDEIGIQTGMSITMCPDLNGSGVGWNVMTPHTAKEFAQLREQFDGEWRAWCQLTYAALKLTGQNEEALCLTTREHDCLAYVADGLRMAEIAFVLGLAETTVEMHLRNARKRLGAKTRDHAVAIAVRRKLI